MDIRVSFMSYRADVHIGPFSCIPPNVLHLVLIWVSSSDHLVATGRSHPTYYTVPSESRGCRKARLTVTYMNTPCVLVQCTVFERKQQYDRTPLNESNLTGRMIFPVIIYSPKQHRQRVHDIAHKHPNILLTAIPS